MSASLADLLFYEELPHETRAILERVWSHRTSDVMEEQLLDAFSEGHAEGYDEGHATGYEEGYDAGVEAVNNDLADNLCKTCGSHISACFNCAGTD